MLDLNGAREVVKAQEGISSVPYPRCTLIRVRCAREGGIATRERRKEAQLGSTPPWPPKHLSIVFHKGIKDMALVVQPAHVRTTP